MRQLEGSVGSAEPKKSPFRSRAFAILGVLACAGALGAWAWRDVTQGVERADAAAKSRLATAAESVDRLLQAEQAQLGATLRATRTELRAKDVWQGAGRGEADRPHDLRPDSGSIDARRLDSVLRHALERAQGVFALEIVVAGHAGLALQGVERGPEGIVPRRYAEASAEGIAKALWYSEEVSRAVERAGRRVEQGEISFEAAKGGDDALERPYARTVIALHEAGELVQGALIAVSDRSRAGDALAPVVPAAVDLALVTMDGRPLSAGPDPANAPSIAALAGEVFAREAWTDAIAVDGAWVLGRPLGTADGVSPMLLALVRTPAATSANALGAWLATPWPVTLGLSAVLTLLALSGATGRATAAQDDGRRRRKHGDPADPADEIELHPEDVIMREWLADVRGCLEREAAVRGLALDLRCASDVPEGASLDPAWLGGLLVAMGREALDATADDSIALEVMGSTNGLRFEVEAGGVSLTPIAGMQTIARALGARFEAGQRGRLSLVLPA